jgi:G:T-mismatch repair DNA endonuclease (very short patch repair protein)
MRDDVGFLIGCGFNIAQISEITGISEPTLYRHQPQELKDEKKILAGEVGGEALRKSYDSALTREQTVKTSDMLRNSSQPKPEEIVECERCHVHSSNCKPWHGHNLCEGCFKKAEFNPEAYDGYFRYLERAKNHQVPQKLLPAKPQETWQQRKAVMQPQKSKPEMDLLEELSNRGITPETDRWICLWGTKPDGDYPDKKIAYYVHGEPHDKGKALDRDDEIRAALEKDGWTVFVFRHDEGNVKEWADKIEEALKW